MPRAPKPQGWRALVAANPMRTAIATVAAATTLLGALPAWWAVEDHFWLRREAVAQVEDWRVRMETNRLWSEYGRLDQTRQRLEKAVRDAGYRQQAGGKLSPAEQYSLIADQADLASTNAAMIETKRAINALHAGK
jgi:hypothetical protein